jgi:hypothetical protein
MTTSPRRGLNTGTYRQNRSNNLKSHHRRRIPAGNQRQKALLLTETETADRFSKPMTETYPPNVFCSSDLFTLSKNIKKINGFEFS